MLEFVSCLLRHLDKLACHLDEFGNKLVSPFRCHLGFLAMLLAKCFGLGDGFLQRGNMSLTFGPAISLQTSRSDFPQGMVGQLCVVGNKDGRIAMEQLRPDHASILWAAAVKGIAPLQYRKISQRSAAGSNRKTTAGG